jgi:predicted amidohydrolase
MSNIRVSIYQKSINRELTSEQKQKISAQKSDFLVLPRYFPFFSGWSSDQEQKEKKYIDTLLEISEYHKGVVIGGSIFRKQNNHWIESIPIVQDLNLIDYCDVKTDYSIGGIQVKGIEGESIYILGGVRFAILCGDDLFQKNALDRIASERVELILNPTSIKDCQNEYQEDLESYQKVSKEYNFHIIRSSAIGSFGEIQFIGRSLYTTNTGVKWKVAPTEKNQEILKTVNVSILDNLPR